MLLFVIINGVVKVCCWRLSNWQHPTPPVMINPSTLQPICCTESRFSQCTIQDRTPWYSFFIIASNERHGVSSHYSINCLFNSLFGMTTKETSRRGPLDSHHKRPLMKEAFPFPDFIMCNHHSNGNKLAFTFSFMKGMTALYTCGCFTIVSWKGI